MNILPRNLHESIHFLRDLVVTLPDGFDVDDGSRVDVCPSLQSTLPSLQRLNVIVRSLNHRSNLLSSITSSQLSSVEVFHCSPAIHSDLYALFLEIKRIYKRSPNFHALYARRPRRVLTSDPSYNFPQSTVTPLLACHRSRVLKFVSFGTLDIDSALVTRAMQARPDIEILYLYKLQERKTHLTTESTRVLLRGCPRLSLPCTAINARTLPLKEPEVHLLSLLRSSALFPLA